MTAAEFTIAPYGDARLPAFADWWNRAFAAARNFYPVSPELLRKRIVERVTAVESFDPAGLLLACEGERVVGAVHAGVLPEAACRALDPAWPGGTRGYVALLQVLPEWRRRGLGAALWERAATHLAGCREVFVDGRGLNPYYGNSDAPATPFFGTSEGLGLDAADSATREFLERRGHRPSAAASTLEWNAQEAPAFAGGEGSSGLRPLRVTEFHPEIGCPLADPGAGRIAHPFFAEVLVENDLVAGVLSAYEMIELGRAHWGIYQLAVAESRRGQGGGRTLLARALEGLRERGARTCEVLTLPELSPAACALYRKAGFRPAAEWAVYG